MGLYGMQIGEAVRQVFKPPFHMKMFVQRMEFIGNKSLGVVLPTGMFTGMVMTFQSTRSRRDFNSVSIVGG